MCGQPWTRFLALLARSIECLSRALDVIARVWLPAVHTLRWRSTTIWAARTPCAPPASFRISSGRESMGCVVSTLVFPGGGVFHACTDECASKNRPLTRCLCRAARRSLRQSGQQRRLRVLPGPQRRVLRCPERRDRVPEGHHQAEKSAPLRHLCICHVQSIVTALNSPRILLRLCRSWRSSS